MRQDATAAAATTATTAPSMQRAFDDGRASGPSMRCRNTVTQRMDHLLPSVSHAALVAMLLLLALPAMVQSAGTVGVCYGLYNREMNHTYAAQILQRGGWTHIKTYWADYNWLSIMEQTYANTTGGVHVTIALANGELQRAATNTNGFVDQLISTTRRFRRIIKYIAIGNEPYAPWNRAEAMPHLMGAHERVLQALRAAGLDGDVKLVVPWSAEVIINTYPYTASVVDPGILPTINLIMPYIMSSGSAFEINLYPYFSYSNSYPNIPLDYCLGNNGDNVTGSQLINMIEGTKVALRKIGYNNVPIVIGETGWPTAGTQHALPNRAQTYLYHLKTAATVTQTDIYIFAAFDEPNKPQGAQSADEFHFGFMTSTGEPKFDFSAPGGGDPGDSGPNVAAIVAGVLVPVGLLLLAGAIAAYVIMKRRSAQVDPGVGKDAGSTAPADVEAAKTPEKVPAAPK